VTGKTIVYLPNWLGDMVMAIPLLQSLRASLDGELWAIGKSKALQLYSGSDLFDRFVPYSGRGLITFFDTVSFLKNLGFKRGIIMPHSFRSALTFFAANVADRVGYARNSRGFLLTSRVEEKVRPEPTVEHYLRIVDILGGKRVSEAPTLAVAQEEEQRFDEKYMDMRRPYVVFITGAQYGPSKCWPENYFSQLADRVITEGNMNVYILPGLGEEALAQKIMEGVEHREQVAMKSMDVKELKVCLSRAAAVISNDTGPRHIAAALSVPTIVLLGPMDERYTVYQSTCTHTIRSDVSCRPCNRKKCDKDHACLTGIKPEEVFDKLEEDLELRPSAAH